MYVLYSPRFFVPSGFLFPVEYDYFRPITTSSLSDRSIPPSNLSDASLLEDQNNEHRNNWNECSICFNDIDFHTRSSYMVCMYWTESYINFIFNTVCIYYIAFFKNKAFTQYIQYFFLLL